MLTNKGIIIVAMLGFLTGSTSANETYELVKVWPEVPYGWHFYSPRGVAVDKTGNVYIADSGNHCIKKFDPNGRFILQWGTPGEGQAQFRGITNIEVDNSGIVYVMDWDSVGRPTQSRIQKFTSYGEFIGLFERKGPGVEQFNLKVDLAISPNGDIFVLAVDKLPNIREPRAVRIEKFTPGGELIAHWGKIGQEDGAFEQPMSIVVDVNGNVYVTDRVKMGVQKFDSDGKFLAKWEGWGATDGLFNLPTAVAFDKEGNMYVLDRYSIQKFTPQGEFLARWKIPRKGRGGMFNMWQIAVGPSGRIYATDFAEHKVWEFDPSGKVISQWASAGKATGEQFSEPGNLAISSSGNLFVSDFENCRIHCFTPEGKFLSTWRGSYWWYDIACITADTSGNLYVTVPDSHEVQKFNDEQKLVIRWGSRGNDNGQFGGYFSGVAVGPEGNVYIADSDNCRIQKFSPDGKFLTKWGTEGTEEGQLKYPNFVAVDGHGNVYVQDRLLPEKTRMQKFDSNGRFLMKLAVPQGTKAVDSSGNIYCFSGGTIKKYDSSGQLFTAFGKEGAAKEMLGEVSAMCIDSSGYLYIAEEDNECIRKLDSEGKLLKQWTAQTIEGLENFPYRPNLIAVDGAGNIYVSRWGIGTICKISVESNTETVFNIEPPFHRGGFIYPGGVAADGSGNIYIVDKIDTKWMDPSIQKFDLDGKFIAQWGGRDKAKGELNYPVSVAVDTSGNTYVTDEGNHLIHKYNAEGKFIKSWGGKGTGDCQFDTPEGIAVDKFGNVYVCDRQNCRIQKFDPEGKFLIKWGQEGSGDGEFHFPAAVAVDKEDYVFVADSDNNRIQKFTSSGKFLTKWGEFGEAPGQFRVPLGITVDKSGNVYVSDSHNHRIQKFAPISN